MSQFSSSKASKIFSSYLRVEMLFFSFLAVPYTFAFFLKSILFAQIMIGFVVLCIFASLILHIFSKQTKTTITLMRKIYLVLLIIQSLIFGAFVFLQWDFGSTILVTVNYFCLIILMPLLYLILTIFDLWKSEKPDQFNLIRGKLSQKLGFFRQPKIRNLSILALAILTAFLIYFLAPNGSLLGFWPRSQDLAKTCGLEIVLKEDQKIKLEPLQNIQNLAKTKQILADYATYYNENEDVFELYYKDSSQNRDKSFLTIACENRLGGQEFVADGWGWYANLQAASENYNPFELYMITGWDIFKDPDFIQNSKNIRGVVAKKNFKSSWGMPTNYENRFYLKFEYRGKKYRIDGDINADNYNKYGAKDVNLRPLKSL